MNPPYFIRVVEVVPAPFTSATVTERTVEWMRAVGQAPVVERAELPGFAVNRIQYPVILECFKLVQVPIFLLLFIHKEL